MTEPRTEAGTRLLTDLTDLDSTGAAPTGMYLGPNGVLLAILAIEAEATAAAERRLRANVLALHTAVCACPADGSDPDCHLSVGPVLALLDSDAPSPRETTSGPFDTPETTSTASAPLHLVRESR